MFVLRSLYSLPGTISRELAVSDEFDRMMGGVDVIGVLISSVPLPCIALSRIRREREKIDGWFLLDSLCNIISVLCRIDVDRME